MKQRKINDRFIKGHGMHLKKKLWVRYFKTEWPLHVMLLLPLTLLVIYKYAPMAGIIVAFKKYMPKQGIFGSPWVGLKNFENLFGMPGFIATIRNTLVLSISKICLGIAVPVIFSILLNEVFSVWRKRIVQTIIYMPHFISWVLMASIIFKMLAQYGIANQILISLGIIREPIIFLAKSAWFPGIIIGTDIWKEFGYGTVIYLATIVGINPELYESAAIDGAGRWKQTLYITLPGLTSIIILLAALSMGRILDAGFDQVYNLYSPVVYSTGDIIDTYVYRMAFENNQVSIAVAAGLFKSVISATLMIASYRIAYKISDYRIF